MTDSTDLERQISLRKSSEIGPLNKYKLFKKGALTYIVDSNGRRVSEGYHSFQVFRHADDRSEMVGLLGKLGGILHALRPPTEDEPFFRPSAEGFHELEFRKDLGDRFVIRTGAMKYLVDSFGRKISKGYHEFMERGDKIYGTIGNETEEVEIPKDAVSDFKLSLESGE